MKGADGPGAFDASGVELRFQTAQKLGGHMLHPLAQWAVAGGGPTPRAGHRVCVLSNTWLHCIVLANRVSRGHRSRVGQPRRCNVARLGTAAWPAWLLRHWCRLPAVAGAGAGDERRARIARSRRVKAVRRTRGMGL